MKPPSACRHHCPTLTVSMMVVHLAVSFSVLMIAPFFSKSKVAVSLVNLQRPRLRMLCGLPMVPRLPFFASMEWLLPTVSLSSSAPSVIQFVLSLVHGMSAHLVARAQTSLSIPLFTMLSIVFLLATRVLSVRWIIPSMPPGLLRINCFALIGKPGPESLALTQLKLGSSLPLRIKSMDKSCTWSSTPDSVAVLLLPTCNPKAFLKSPSTSSVIRRLGSVLLLPVETLRLPWRVHFLWSSNKDWMARHAMSGANLAVKPFAKVIIRSWR
mmetsp:Transcript_17016/g.40776  ORF Transcript_17016/g.40776 Transcript_17016/m.40776 type:complete len:269 (+) Transcript_17016:86-892(+)